MKDPTERQSRIPAYIRLYEQLRSDVIRGAYPFGSRLPSKRVLAAETGVSVITVSHALELLCDEGYAEAKERSGCFVIFQKEDFPDAAPPVTGIRRRSAPMRSEEAFPFSVLARAMRRVLLDYGENLLTRAPNAGCEELRAEICNYLARSRSIYISPQQVIVGSGAEYLYGLIAQLVGRERSIAIEDPSYGKIRMVYSAMGIHCDPLPLRPDGIDSADLWKTGASVLHTTPFSSFPSGISASGPKKHEYLQWAEKRGGLIIEDNYDSELAVAAKAEDSLFRMSGGRNVIYINTFSKTIAPSMRIGYMILPEERIGQFEERLGFYSCTVPVFDQYVLAELLRSGDFERHVNRLRRRRRKALESQTR